MLSFLNMQRKDMRKNFPVLDTNVIIRYLKNDNVAQAERVERLLTSEASQKFEIPDLIIAEIIFVLESFYEMEKSSIIEKIGILINFPKIKTNEKIIRKALHLFSVSNISFPDAYLCSLVINKKNTFLYSFDKELKRKNTDIKIQEP